MSMLSHSPNSGDSCHYCGHPVARSSLSFTHRRRAEQVVCALRLCSVCADRVEYHLHIALSNRLFAEPRVPA